MTLMQWLRSKFHKTVVEVVSVKRPATYQQSCEACGRVVAHYRNGKPHARHVCKVANV